MATALKSKSFQVRLLMSIGGVFLLFAVCFSTYQYQREKDSRCDIMHSRLQMYNYEMFQSLGASGVVCDTLFSDYVSTHNVDGLRVTIVDVNGKVLLDSYDRNTAHLDNHLHRVEIQEALRYGNGYDIKRMSESTHETFFYSATRFGNIIVRAAVPYSAELTRSLQADNTYLYFAVALTIMLGIVLFMSTRRISRHIGHLREFAIKAEAGEEIDHKIGESMPHDELGDISQTIIQLYWKLRHSEEDKVRIKRQLTQNAAHELKTPAASIHGYLESILDNPDMPADKRKHFLERCFAQSQRMNSLLLDMSALAKLDELDGDRKALRKDYRQVALMTIVQGVIDDTALQLHEKGIATVVVMDPNAEIFGDQGLIYSIFRNLFDNSIAYAAGATLLKVECKAMEQKGRHFYEFCVSDNGTGVETNHLPHIFERFYRVDKGRSRKLGGTGLGLAIVKNAVAAHGGTVTAEPTPGGGLTVRFTMARF